MYFLKQLTFADQISLMLSLFQRCCNFSTLLGCIWEIIHNENAWIDADMWQLYFDSFNHHKCLATKKTILSNCCVLNKVKSMYCSKLANVIFNNSAGGLKLC